MGEPVEFCCPRCRGALDQGQAESWRCRACGQAYPVVAGIPDFRVFDSFYGARERDRSRVEALLAAFPTSSFAELVALRFKLTPGLRDDLAATYQDYRLRTVSRAEARQAQAAALLSAAGRGLPAGGAALEIGCGVGGGVAALARRYAWAAGFDINMVDLVLARKLLQEQGLANVTLACACAEAIPFQDGSFRLVQALDLIEHVASQRDVVTEGHRLLADGGVFWFTSPNRYYLYGPEPHVFVWGVGFLPRRWQNAYTRLVKGVEYRGKRLLSRRELERLLQEAGIERYTIVDPAPPVDPTRPAQTALGRLGRRLAPWLIGIVNRTIPYLGHEHQALITR
jgi:ubiquinone/menaquinone biosynthesis C-methylase UbiE